MRSEKKPKSKTLSGAYFFSVPLMTNDNTAEDNGKWLFYFFAFRSGAPSHSYHVWFNLSLDDQDEGKVWLPWLKVPADADMGAAQLGQATHWSTADKDAFVKQFPILRQTDVLEQWMLQHGTHCGGSTLWSVLPLPETASLDERRWSFVVDCPRLLLLLCKHAEPRPLTSGCLFEHVTRTLNKKSSTTATAVHTVYQALEAGKREMLACAYAQTPRGADGRLNGRQSKGKQFWFFRSSKRPNSWSIDGCKETEGTVRVLVNA